MSTTETDNLPALPEPEAVDLMAPLGLPSPSEWGALGGMAEQLSRSTLVPKTLRGKPDDVMLVLLVGRDLRLAPTQALFKIHVIEGKPSMSAELQAGVVNRQPGMSIWPDDGNDHTKATAHGSRDGREFQFTFTIEDAARAGLAGKGNWRTWPQFMLWARAVSGLCRMAFSDVLAGVAYTPEELGAEVDPQTGELIDATARETTPAAPQAPQPDECFTLKAVAQIRAACADAGFTEDDIADMVEMGTNGRVSTLEEVTYGERPALAKAKQHIVERKASIADDGLPAHPEFDVDNDDHDDAWWLSIAPQVQAKVDKSATENATAAEYRKLIPGLAALGVVDADDQRRVLGVLLGAPLRSRADLTKSQVDAVISVLDEEGAG